MNWFISCIYLCFFSWHTKYCEVSYPNTCYTWPLLLGVTKQWRYRIIVKYLINTLHVWSLVTNYSHRGWWATECHCLAKAPVAAGHDAMEQNKRGGGNWWQKNVMCMSADFFFVCWNLEQTTLVASFHIGIKSEAPVLKKSRVKLLFFIYSPEHCKCFIW